MPLGLGFCYMGLQLVDLCAYDSVSLAILQDVHLTVAEEFLSWVHRIGIYLCRSWSVCLVDGVSWMVITSVKSPSTMRHSKKVNLSISGAAGILIVSD